MNNLKSKIKYYLSNERRRYLLFLTISMIVLFALIVIQSCSLIINKNYEYAGIIIVVYTIIFVIQFLITFGLKKKKYDIKSIKVVYIISLILLTFMIPLILLFYALMVKNNNYSKLPIWIIIIMLSYAIIMSFHAYYRYRKLKIKYNSYYILYYLVGIASKLISLIIGVNGIVTHFISNHLYLNIEQGILITLILLFVVVETLLKLKNIHEIYDDTKSGLYHESINRFMINFNEVKQLYINSFPKIERIPFDILLLLANKKYVHFNAYYYNDEFIGLCFFTKKKNKMFILYLAVNEKLKGMGYGSIILKSLEPSNNHIYLNVEPIDFNATNNEERIKRIRFYKHNGFELTNYLLNDGNIEYQILATNEFNEKEYSDSIKLMNKCMKVNIKKII